MCHQKSDAAPKNCTSTPAPWSSEDIRPGRSSHPATCRHLDGFNSPWMQPWPPCWIWTHKLFFDKAEFLGQWSQTGSAVGRLHPGMNNSHWFFGCQQSRTMVVNDCKREKKNWELLVLDSGRLDLKVQVREDPPWTLWYMSVSPATPVSGWETGITSSRSPWII